jgi:hypothetical protein
LLPESPGDEPLEITEKSLVVGRSNNSGLQIEDVNVSKFHALFAQEEDGYSIFDLHSVNGTYINDVRITSSKLVDGDIIRFGTVAMRYDATEKKAGIGIAAGKPRIGLKLGGPRPSEPAVPSPAAPAVAAPALVPEPPPAAPEPKPAPAPEPAKRPTIPAEKREDRVFIKLSSSQAKPAPAAGPAAPAAPPPIAAPAPKPAVPPPLPPPVPVTPVAPAAPAATEERPKLRLGGAPKPKPEEPQEEETQSGPPKPKLGFRLKRD